MNANMARKIESAQDALVMMAAPKLAEAVRRMVGPREKSNAEPTTGPTTGRSYPRCKSAKRQQKDTDNQWQRRNTGHGPARTIKG